NAKQPGSEGAIIPVAMDFCQSCEVGLNTPEAYERLLYDAARGDSTYFTRWDEVALAWKYVDKIASAWGERTEDLHLYPAGTWGPERGQQLVAEDGFRWWPVNGQDEGEVEWVTTQR
ncbi:glucose-6-phosphate dehydrogenase, partial [Myxococcus sp. CA039A]|nr:glucose-6-phosphate dehydrogenase [Myxococcus sp. CA039A]